MPNKGFSAASTITIKGIFIIFVFFVISAQATVDSAFLIT